MLKSIREELNVTQALQQAGAIYPRVWEAYDALCWVLAHRQISGAEFPGIRDIYYLHKQASNGRGIPSLAALYTVSPEVISIHSIKIG